MEELSRAFPDVMWRRLVVGYKRFGTPYRPQQKASENQNPPPPPTQRFKPQLSQ